MLIELLLHVSLLVSNHEAAMLPQADYAIIDCFVAGHTSNRLEADFDTMIDGQRYCITVPSDNFDF